jgi:hypothetical protein
MQHISNETALEWPGPASRYQQTFADCADDMTCHLQLYTCTVNKCFTKCMQGKKITKGFTQLGPVVPCAWSTSLVLDSKRPLHCFLHPFLTPPSCVVTNFWMRTCPHSLECSQVLSGTLIHLQAGTSFLASLFMRSHL